MSEKDGGHRERGAPLYALGNVFGAVWILGGTLFFVMRFSSVFYQANRSAIDSILERFLGWHP